MKTHSTSGIRRKIPGSAPILRLPRISRSRLHKMHEDSADTDLRHPPTPTRTPAIRSFRTRISHGTSRVVAPKNSASVMSAVDFARTIEASYRRHPGFRHWFLDWFSQGRFDLQRLRQFALIYYEHVKLFRLYLAGALTIMPDEGLQVALARILADEFATSSHKPDEPLSSHPELFRAFMRSIGLTEDDWRRSHLIQSITHFKQVHFALFRGDLVDEVLGATVFGCERSTPYRHGKVLAGLRRFASQTGAQIDHRFFSEHVSIDPLHSGALIDAALKLKGTLSIERVLQGAAISFNARKILFDGIAAELEVKP